MGTTTFSGPVKAGTIREGSSANVGFVEMAQTAAWTQSASGTSTGIIIPAGSQITEITLYITVAPSAVNLSGGTSATATELFTALAQGSAANVIKQASTATITDADAWADVGTSDVTIFLKSASGSTGRGYVTVKYIQNNNLA
jgi:hypothetical protein